MDDYAKKEEELRQLLGALGIEVLPMEDAASDDGPVAILGAEADLIGGATPTPCSAHGDVMVYLAPSSWQLIERRRAAGLDVTIMCPRCVLAKGAN